MRSGVIVVKIHLSSLVTAISGECVITALCEGKLFGYIWSHQFSVSRFARDATSLT